MTKGGRRPVNFLWRQTTRVFEVVQGCVGGRDDAVVAEYQTPGGDTGPEDPRTASDKPTLHCSQWGGGTPGTLTPGFTGALTPAQPQMTKTKRLAQHRLHATTAAR